MSVADRRAMIEPSGRPVSVRRQCALLALPRSGVYRESSGPAADDLALIRRIDEVHLQLPFYGARRMTF
jgi:putative transposase